MTSRIHLSYGFMYCTTTLLGGWVSRQYIVLFKPLELVVVIVRSRTFIPICAALWMCQRSERQLCGCYDVHLSSARSPRCSSFSCTSACAVG